MHTSSHFTMLGTREVKVAWGRVKRKSFQVAMSTSNYFTLVGRSQHHRGRRGSPIMSTSSHFLPPPPALTRHDNDTTATALCGLGEAHLRGGLWARCHQCCCMLTLPVVNTAPTSSLFSFLLSLSLTTHGATHGCVKTSGRCSSTNSLFVFNQYLVAAST